MEENNNQENKKFVSKLVDKLKSDNQNIESVNKDIPQDDSLASLSDLEENLMKAYEVQLIANQRCKEANATKKEADRLVRLLKMHIRNY